MKSGFKIKTISAYVSTDKDGTEGVIGSMAPDGQWLPFVCADEDRANSLKPLAKEIAKASGKKVKLVRFSQREDLEEIN